MILQRALFLPAVALVLSLSMVVWDLQSHLQETNDYNTELRERLQTQVTCSPVQVTCVCPDIPEECDSTAIPLDDLELVCAELEEFGYVPGC